MPGVIKQLRDYGRAEPSRDAIVTSEGTVSLGELLARVEAAASDLVAAGIGPRTVVGLSIADEAEHLVASLALLAAGARQLTLATFDATTVRAPLATRIGATHVVAASAADALEGTTLVL